MIFIYNKINYYKINDLWFIFYLNVLLGLFSNKDQYGKKLVKKNKMDYLASPSRQKYPMGTPSSRFSSFHMEHSGH